MAEIVTNLSEYDNGDGSTGEGNIYQPAVDRYMASVPANATDEQLATVIAKWERMIEHRQTTTVDGVKLSPATLRALVAALRAHQLTGA